MIYGLGGTAQDALRYSKHCINAFFHEPLERSATLKLMRSTRPLVLHEPLERLAIERRQPAFGRRRKRGERREVTVVTFDRVGCEPALDAQMIEERADGVRVGGVRHRA